MKVLPPQNHLESFLIAFNNDVSTMSLVDKKFAKIAEEIFKKVNEEITQKLPDLLHILNRNNNSITAQGTFKILINHLHDTANELDCDQKAPTNLTCEQRMTWEIVNWKAILDKVKEKQENLANIYEQMQTDLENQKDSESKKKAKETIDAALNFLFRKEEYLELVAERKKNLDSKPNFSLEGTKIFVHIENGHVDTIVRTLPGFLANVYQEAKSHGKLKEYFNSFKSNEGFCLEASMRSIEQFMFSLWS